MDSPNRPPRTLVAKSSILPTVILAPPPELEHSRSLNVMPVAWIPLVISSLIIIATAIYVWKLWQREDKYYVEEHYPDEEDNDLEATAINPGTVSNSHPDLVRERLPRTPESWVAAREEVGATTVRPDISRPLGTSTVPLNIRDQARNGDRTPGYASPNSMGLIQAPELIASASLPSRLSGNDETTFSFPTIDDAVSPKSTDTWGFGDGEMPATNRLSADLPQVPVQEDVQAEAAEANIDHSCLAAIEYNIHRSSDRLSGIDWKDDGSSIQGSEFTKYGTSELDRSSYANRYEDY